MGRVLIARSGLYAAGIVTRVKAGRQGGEVLIIRKGVVNKEAYPRRQEEEGRTRRRDEEGRAEEGREQSAGGREETGRGGGGNWGDT